MCSVSILTALGYVEFTENSGSMLEDLQLCRGPFQKYKPVIQVCCPKFNFCQKYLAHSSCISCSFIVGTCYQAALY